VTDGRRLDCDCVGAERSCAGAVALGRAGPLRPRRLADSVVLEMLLNDNTDNAHDMLVQHAAKLRRELEELWMRRVWIAFFAGATFGAIGMCVMHVISIVN
jgi:hypothetical protein